MDLYLGCDPHSRSCTISVRDARGKRVRRDVVETRRDALVSYLGSLRGTVHLCVEEGEWSQWFSEILTPHVHAFAVVQPERKGGSKNDGLDADDLAEKMRTGRLGRTVFKDRGQVSALRDLARTYGMLTDDVARTKNRLKSFFRARGIDCSGTAIYHPERRVQLSEELPPSAQKAVAFLGQELASLEALKEESQKAMLQECRKVPISRILATAPGLGPIRVAQLIPVVVNPWRFRTKRQFWQYCGFGIVTRSSSDWVLHKGRWIRANLVQTRGLNRNHNRRLKSLFKQAATTVLQAGHAPLQDHYDRLLANGTKPNLAKLTIARQIAAIVLAMWKKEEPYRPEMVSRTPTS